MKALTILQPWATLIAIGAKKIETRSWPTRYRGPLAIHAAKALPADLRAMASTEPFRSTLIASGDPAFPDVSGIGWALPTNQIVAIANLVDCVEVISQLRADYLTVRDSRFCKLLSSIRHLSIKENEHNFGDFHPGRFLWLLEDVVKLDPPLTPPPGGFHRGLWEWDAPPAIAALLKSSTGGTA